MTNIYITLSTSVLQINTTPATVLLSTLNAPGAVFTIRDIGGTATQANPITISTTSGVRFYDTTSSIQITQPYGYVTVNPNTSTIWSLQNSFAFPDTQAVANVRGVNASYLTASTLIANTLAVSTINATNFTLSSLSTLQTMTILGNLSTASTVQIGATLNVRNLSVMSDFLINGHLSTISSINTGGTLTVRQQSFFTGPVSTGANVNIGGALSTAGALEVRGLTTFNSSVTVIGGFQVNGSFTASSTITIQGALNVVGQATFNSTALFTQGANMSTSATVLGNMSVGNNATVANSTVTGTLNILNAVTFSNAVTTLSSIIATSSIVVGSNVNVGRQLNASTISTTNTITALNAQINNQLLTSSLFVTNTAYFSGPTLFQSSLGVACNSPNYTMDVNGTINAGNYLVNGLPFESGASFSTLIVSSLSVKQNMYLGGTEISASGTYDPPTIFSSRDTTRNWSAIAMSSNGSYQLASVGIGSGFLYTSYDSGNNWTQRSISFSWTDVAVSGSGQYMMAGGSGLRPYISSDYGQNWTQSDTGLGLTVSISSNGQYMITGQTSFLFLSANFGASFTSISFSTNTPTFNQVALNSNGSMIAAATTKGIYRSTDFGATFTSTLTSSNYSKISISANGQYMTAINSTGPQLNISVNSGASWVAVDSVRLWTSVCVSASGQYQLATVTSGGRVYWSSNYGSNWTATASSQQWSDVATSADGTMVSLAVNGGTLFVKQAILTLANSANVIGNLNVGGTLSKTAGSFEIPHPIKANTLLTHSFIEGPRADLLYRGKATLRQGQGYVDIEQSCTANGSVLTPGTFVALATHPQVYLQNNDSFDYVKGIVSANILSIQCENSNFNGSCDWMIMAERHDPSIKKWTRTDEDGFLVLEHPR